ncbi:uncharacterized protein [Rutidosis leptorrhynchoides]|uniref:uncharacterized protein n=1 Tax=Rutidosis leptorrhynchoides TaxID=125765 RepID=UPI003A995320
MALMTTHTWRLFTCKQSLWVRWIHEYRLRGTNFWSAPNVAGASVGWRKLLEIREVVCNRFIFKIGDVVRELVGSGGWNWPRTPHALHAHPDTLKWRSYEGDLHDFSVNLAWHAIRNRAHPVQWFSVVWFAKCIPKHSFMVWLLMGERLKTQDRLKAWEISSRISQVCSLCLREADSHEHLFFKCLFAKQVWTLATKVSRVNLQVDSWKDVVDVLSPIAFKRSARVIVSKLLFGASVYGIWRERNARLFNKKALSCAQVFEVIFSTVRLKIMSIKCKTSSQVQEMKTDWKVP